MWSKGLNLNTLNTLHCWQLHVQDKKGWILTEFDRLEFSRSYNVKFKITTKKVYIHSYLNVSLPKFYLEVFCEKIEF
jgi:hypothetical protein